LCFKSFAKKGCEKTCDRCEARLSKLVNQEVGKSSEEDGCTDAGEWCQYYKEYCTSHEPVKKHCKKMCNLCTTPTTPTVNECKNKHPQCSSFKQYGLCGKYGVNYCPLACGLCCGDAPLNPLERTGAIVNGEAAQPGYFPWQVGVFLNKKFHCGASLVGDQYFVSAAHCFDDKNEDYRQMTVKVGDNNRGVEESWEEEYNIVSLTPHPGWDVNQYLNDIVVGKMSGVVKKSDKVFPICLPGSNEKPEVGTQCAISGWGKGYAWGRPEQILQYIHSPIVEQSECTKRNSRLKPVVKTNICAGKTDGSSFSSACHGDSGGPLACIGADGKWKLHGVVSWGDTQCNAMNLYNVFTRVSEYTSWINKNMS